MRGFTLLELLVSLAVATLLLGAVVGNYSKLYEAMEYHSAVRGIFTEMNRARVETVRTGKPATFFVDLASRDYGVNDETHGQIPEVLDMRLIVAERDLDGQSRGYIRFFPEGGATGGSVDLIRQTSREGVRLRVDWLFGRISQELLQP